MTLNMDTRLRGAPRTAVITAVMGNVVQRAKRPLMAALYRAADRRNPPVDGGKRVRDPIKNTMRNGMQENVIKRMKEAAGDEGRYDSIVMFYWERRDERPSAIGGTMTKSGRPLLRQLTVR